MLAYRTISGSISTLLTLRSSSPRQRICSVCRHICDVSETLNCGIVSRELRIACHARSTAGECVDAEGLEYKILGIREGTSTTIQRKDDRASVFSKPGSAGVRAFNFALLVLKAIQQS